MGYLRKAIAWAPGYSSSHDDLYARALPKAGFISIERPGRAAVGGAFEPAIAAGPGGLRAANRGVNSRLPAPAAGSVLRPPLLGRAHRLAAPRAGPPARRHPAPANPHPTLSPHRAVAGNPACPARRAPRGPAAGSAPPGAGPAASGGHWLLLGNAPHRCAATWVAGPTPRRGDIQKEIKRIVATSYPRAWLQSFLFLFECRLAGGGVAWGRAGLPRPRFLYAGTCG